MNQGHDARHKRLAERLSYLRARIAMIRETRVAHEKNPTAEAAGLGLVQVVVGPAFIAVLYNLFPSFCLGNEAEEKAE